MLTHNLPKIITDIDGIRDVLLSIEPEIQLMRDDLSALVKELYVRTTQRFITRWEKDFGLAYDSSLNLIQRRQRILNKLARKKTLNWENLRLLIKNNVKKPQFYIVNDSKNYHFRIILQENDYALLENALNAAKPAYLTFDITVTEYFRRCGTFECGASIL